jgi:hypothetical protein
MAGNPGAPGRFSQNTSPAICREKRLDGLLDEPRPGRPREICDDEIAETVRLTLETTPKDATHWSLRPMAEAVDHAPSTIHRIWRALASL